MEKLESKLRHMEYFVMKSQNTTIEEKLELLEAIGEMKKKECRICHKEFVPRNSVQCLCSFECANTNKKLKDAEYRKKQFEKY